MNDKTAADPAQQAHDLIAAVADHLSDYDGDYENADKLGEARYQIDALAARLHAAEEVVEAARPFAEPSATTYEQFERLNKALDAYFAAAQPDSDTDGAA